jgi:hypothetical protein
MTELTATIRLRPTRVGFLVNPTDLKSVRTIMRACACLWGGIFNPIIPVFRSPPREWRSKGLAPVKGPAVAREYIEYFEPDVFVTAEDGLLEMAGLTAFAERHTVHSQICSLKEFLSPQPNRDWSEPAFGLNVTDVYKYRYDTEQKFKQKRSRQWVRVPLERSGGLVESVFGAFPEARDVAYISTAYQEIFEAGEEPPTPALWKKVFMDGTGAPLHATSYGLEIPRSWHDDPIVFVFDSRRATDLIELWNMRLQAPPVLPVPISWFRELSESLRIYIDENHRPVRGNPHGLMHSVAVQFSRSIPESKCNELLMLVLPSTAQNRHFMFGRSGPVAMNRDDNVGYIGGRIELTVNERRTSIKLNKEATTTVSFEALFPKFASRYGGHKCRWVNAVKVSQYGERSIATVLPFNTFDRRWPRMRFGGDDLIVGKEGWIFGQTYSRWTESFTPLSMEEAIVGSLNRQGIEAVLSEPGQIARQMLERVGGLYGVELLADVETLNLLNKMAGGLRRRRNETDTVEEHFEQRTASVADWKAIAARRSQGFDHGRNYLESFTKSSILLLGLETECPDCRQKNWHSLSIVDYKVACERCLNHYEFPQARLRDDNRNWRYRVTGPFAVPDFGRGSYSALLTLRVLGSLGGSSAEMTYATAMDLKFDGVRTEVDFAALHRIERTLGSDRQPDLIIGEAKSMGQGDLLKPSDFKKLRAIGEKLLGAFIVISILREEFSASEKRLLRNFVKWSRRADDDGRQTNPVVLLTGRDLCFRFDLGHTWTELGEPYRSYSNYQYMQSLPMFADATQAIHLGLPPFQVERRQRQQVRFERKAKAKVIPPKRQ